MTADELETFKDLYEKIAALKVVKCRLNHERILYDKETNLPLAECLPELGYKNIGLCSPEIRRERVACGHTMARYDLENALLLLASNGVAIENLNAELQRSNRRHPQSRSPKRLCRKTSRSTDGKATRRAGNGFDGRNSKGENGDQRHRKSAQRMRRENRQGARCNSFRNECDFKNFFTAEKTRRRRV